MHSSPVSCNFLSHQYTSQWSLQCHTLIRSCSNLVVLKDGNLEYLLQTLRAVIIPCRRYAYHTTSVQQFTGISVSEVFFSCCISEHSHMASIAALSPWITENSPCLWLLAGKPNVDYALRTWNILHIRVHHLQVYVIFIILLNF